MALVFEVETGDGSPTATSYVSVEFADDYLAIKSNAITWLALDDTEKQNFLMWSTRILDQRVTWAGVKMVPTSNLEWPRAYVKDKYGYPVCSDCVPREVAWATVEIAFNLFINNIDPSDSGGSSGTAGGAIKRIKADVVEIEYTEGSAGTSGSDFPKGINAILNPLGFLNGGGSMGFKRISKS